MRATRARLSCWSSHAGTIRPDRALATILHGRRGPALSQGTARRDQVCHRAEQLVRALAERGVGLLEEAARLSKLVALQVDEGERDERRGVRALVAHPSQGSRARPASRRGTAGRAGLPPAPGVRPARLPRASRPVCPRRPARLEEAAASSETAGPQCDGGPAGQHASSRLLDAGPASPPGPG